MGRYSNDSAGSACVRPYNTRSSAPSTSIFTNAGTPKRAISVSSLTLSISIARFHSTRVNPASRLRTSRHGSSSVVTVGVRSLTAIDAPVALARGRFEHLHSRRACEQQAQQPREIRLRLERHDAAAECRKCPRSIARMCAEVEHEVARRDELTVELAQPPLAERDAVIDGDRARRRPTVWSKRLMGESACAGPVVESRRASAMQVRMLSHGFSRAGRWPLSISILSSTRTEHGPIGNGTRHWRVNSP